MPYRQGLLPLRPAFIEHLAAEFPEAERRLSTAHVRFGSLADINAVKSISALPPKVDITQTSGQVR